jgi:hypothetical protein
MGRVEKRQGRIVFRRRKKEKNGLSLYGGRGQWLFKEGERKENLKRFKEYKKN